MLNAKWLLVPMILTTLTAASAQQAGPDMTKIENRNIVLKERRGIDCKGVYQQTKRKLDFLFKWSEAADIDLTISPSTLAKMTELTTAIGQKRREFCEYYKHTPEWTFESYLAVYGEFDKVDYDLQKIMDAIAAQARARRQGKTPEAAGNLSALSSISPINGVSDIQVRTALMRLRDKVNQIKP